MNLQYRTVQQSEMKPDLYDGPNCDIARPRWVADIEKEGPEEIPGNIVLDPSKFPPGTRVLIQVPVCPDCGLDEEFAADGRCGCGFDWHAWRDNQYS
jgi:hypothetical protein